MVIDFRNPRGILGSLEDLWGYWIRRADQVLDDERPVEIVCEALVRQGGFYRLAPGLLLQHIRKVLRHVQDSRSQRD